jgi:hypothetical protein
MKRLIAVAALTFIGIGAGYADNSQGQNQQGQNQNQQGQDPFNQVTDSGDQAHVLPAPDVLLGPGGAKPTSATATGKATVYPPSYGSGNLTDHHGPEISNANFYAVYWGASVANAVSSQIQAFVSAFGGNTAPYNGSNTDDLPIIQQYGSSNPIAPGLGGNQIYVDTSKSPQSSISDSGIRNWLQGLFRNGKITPNANTVYGLYFPANMKININFFQASCTSFCGYHSSFTYNNMAVKYAVFPYPNCSGCSISGYSTVDMLTVVSSHEIREAISDPLGNAWYDSSGYEADDKCVWHNLYRMTTGQYLVQPEYSNGGTLGGITYPGPGCVVP